MGKAHRSGRSRRTRGSKSDPQLYYVTDLNPKLEQWRVLGAEWLETLTSNKGDAMKSIKNFLVDYVHAQGLSPDPATFLSKGYQAPCLYAACLSHFSGRRLVLLRYRTIVRFIDYVLIGNFSVEDDNGCPIVPPEFGNPIPELPEEIGGSRVQRTESDKNVLPYHYIEELRSILWAKEAKDFIDWTWAQLSGNARRRGDWFVVPQSLIDVDDPDCVWRTRATSTWERRKCGYGEIVHEMWSPTRSVALYLKLELPLRTYQVRMLDSGEADTWSYVKGAWVRNSGPLTIGTEKNPCRRGIFRRMTDNLSQLEMTGLFINTNKTADNGKDEWGKGYDLPWQHDKVLYWLEKLRNWQVKYNPIPTPTPWTSLKRMHTGDPKASATLKTMGATCFLFRDATAQHEDRFKPLPTGYVEWIWKKLLKELERRCDARKERGLGGAKLEFVPPDRTHSLTTYYPLHSLRVSLITAYALEGGVPMPILSKCIAGHTRLVMTIYYTKAGITYVTEQMIEAEKRLAEGEQANYARWLKDATYKDLEAHGAFFHPAAIQAVVQAQSIGASLTKDDKGYCTKGGLGCDFGGVYTNDETGQVTYGEVPGFPEKNCPRCRWFFTEPGFLGGLWNHWNNIALKMGDIGERIVQLEGQINLLEDERFECEAADLPFLHHDKLNTLRRVWQAEVEKNDKLGKDINATLRLAVRCQVIANNSASTNGIQLVAAGSITDVRIAIQECGKLQQILTAVAGSTIYAEHDVSKAALQAGRAYDMMLAMNGKQPLFFRLSEEELLPVVQHTTRLIQAEAGSIRDAVPYIEGRQRLEELGLNGMVDDLVRDIASGRFVPLTMDAGILAGNGTRRLTAMHNIEERL